LYIENVKSFLHPGNGDTLKNKIRDIRKKMKLSQEDLAIRCGVTRQTINAIENDKYDPTLTLAFKLSNQLKITVDQLFTYKEDSK